MNDLNERQMKFCEEWIIDFNATRAAIAVGYSPKTAAVQGCDNLNKPNIQKYLKELKAERESRTKITQDMVVQEFAKIAFIDIRDFYCDITGELLQPSELPDHAAKAVSSFKMNIITIRPGKNGKPDIEESIAEYKLWNKEKSLEALGKHTGVFEKDNKQKQPINNFKMGFNDFYNKNDEDL